jgi:hypothetical protein
LGYRLQLVDGAAHFAWRGQRRPAVSNETDSEARALADSPFSILAGVSFAPPATARRATAQGNKKGR